MTAAMKKTVWLAGCNSGIWTITEDDDVAWTFERYASEMARPQPNEFHTSKAA